MNRIISFIKDILLRNIVMKGFACIISFISTRGLLSSHRILRICLMLLRSLGLSTFYPHARCFTPLSGKCLPIRSWIESGMFWRPRKCTAPYPRSEPCHAFWGSTWRGRSPGSALSSFQFCRRWSSWTWEGLYVPSTLYQL